MPSYYVMHPSVGFSALVEAPSTEKARTVYLDYLERQGSILRGDRQHLRRNMVASRVSDPGEISTDITLSYGYEEARTYEAPVQIERPEIHELPLQMEQPGVHEVPTQIEQPQVHGVPVSRLSPIEQASLGRV